MRPGIGGLPATPRPAQPAGDRDRPAPRAVTTVGRRRRPSRSVRPSRGRPGGCSASVAKGQDLRSVGSAEGAVAREKLRCSMHPDGRDPRPLALDRHRGSGEHVRDAGDREAVWSAPRSAGYARAWPHSGRTARTRVIGADREQGRVGVRPATSVRGRARITWSRYPAPIGDFRAVPGRYTPDCDLGLPIVGSICPYLPVPGRAARRQVRADRADLRVSVTDRCNLRCTYCIPAEGFRGCRSPRC